MGAYRDLRTTFGDQTEWSIPHVLRTRARTHGDAVYLDVPSTGESYTYREMLTRAERVGSSLLAAGAQPGDRLLLMAPNSSAYVTAWFGSALAGLVEVPVNVAYRGSFLEHQVRTVAPRFAVIAAEYADRFVESAEASSSIERFYLVGGAAERADATRRLHSAGWSAEPFEVLLDGPLGSLPEICSRSLASVFFTSGTTGLSKGVMMPHAQMHFFAEECVSLTRLTDRDVYMSVGPLFHGNAQFLAALPALIAGARFVLREKFSASGWIDWVRRSGVTVTNFVGVMMDFVWKQAPQGDDRDNRLRCVFAAPTASSILEAFKERFGIEAFVEVFGLTETSMPIMTPYGVDRPPGAAGLAVDEWFDVRLADPETDREVSACQVGELLVRPKVPWTTCQGYFGMPETTVEAFRNLWFHTGDGLRRDEDGWFYFVDRLKDALRRRGENISSYEVEQAILPYAAVEECAVIAVPAESEAGEDEVMAVIVPARGASPTPDELWEWCDRRLPQFAVPRYIEFVERLPKTPSEKVQKAKLREVGVTSRTADRQTMRQPEQELATQ